MHNAQTRAALLPILLRKESPERSGKWPLQCCHQILCFSFIFPSNASPLLLSLLTSSFLAGLQQIAPSHHSAQVLWPVQSQIIFAVVHLREKVLQN